MINCSIKCLAAFVNKSCGKGKKNSKGSAHWECSPNNSQGNCRSAVAGLFVIVVGLALKILVGCA